MDRNNIGVWPATLITVADPGYFIVSSAVVLVNSNVGATDTAYKGCVFISYSAIRAAMTAEPE